MTSTRKISVITGSRADYGLLQPVIRKINACEGLAVQIVATGAHLEKEHGYTYREIEKDGFRIDRKIELLAQPDTEIGVARSMGLCLNGVANALMELKPDLTLVLGDRYEIFAAVQASMVCHIPVAHIGGGDVGSGTYDNLIRHCITKMSALHFVTHLDAYRRVVQLGEDPEHVFNVGSTCVENARNTRLLDKEELAQSLGVALNRKTYLVTYHPLTMGSSSGMEELNNMLQVLAAMLPGGETTLLFTRANADQGGRQVNQILESFVDRHANCHLVDSLGRLRYLSAINVADVAIGNSSSGIYEAPYLNTPTVDIGLRQKDRKAPSSVFHAAGDEESIRNAIESALAFQFDAVDMVYGEGTTSDSIVGVLQKFGDFAVLNQKAFFDLRH